MHWTPAVVLDKGGKRGDGVIHVGLPDGRIVPLTTYTYAIRRALNLYDVVYVDVIDGRAPPANSRARSRPAPAHAEIRVRPTVQGAVLVLDNKTGRILAMVGGFSYPLSQLNRTWQTERQPGSAIKPITYLTALQKGLQPNTLVLNQPITLPPIGNRQGGTPQIAYDNSGQEKDYWTPRNADGSSSGVYTMRFGLEHSVNMITAHLLDGGIDADPEQSLDDVCATAVAAKIYTDCVRYYPFVLGAQPVHMIDLAAFYAAIANEGVRPQPHAIDSIEEAGQTIYAISEGAAVPANRRRRPGEFLSAQDHPAGRGRAWHRARHRLAVAIRRRQDRDDGGCGRRLVRGLHQRRDGRSLGRLRQWRRQAPLSRRR